jgi:hypothetical protein
MTNPIKEPNERNTYNLAEIIKHSPYFLKGNPWELAKDILSKSPRASEGLEQLRVKNIKGFPEEKI